MAKYRLDSQQGRFVVQAFAEGMLSSFGHNPTLAAREFSGEIDFDPESADSTIVRVTVKAASLEVTDDVSAKDRQEIETRTRDEVLEAAKYPEIVFRSTGGTADKVTDNQFRFRVQGTMALHGAQKSQPLELQLRCGASDLRLGGECRIKLSDYQIKRVSAVGGAIRVKDELKLSFELVALKQDA